MNRADLLVMYMRISAEDQEKHTGRRDESNSITNQRTLLEGYIKNSPELAQYDPMEVCDDGYSGTNLNRPGMRRLLGMAREGQVGCILVKDFSRFGRDYLMVSDYIDQIFPFMGIRFISVNDHYDSAVCKGTTSGVDMAFRNVLYGYYSQDLSTKVKSGKRTKAEKGAFLSPFAPIGYQKSPGDKNRLVVEPVGAVIVRKIFGMAGTGMGVMQITRVLNREGIPTPGQVKAMQGKHHKRWSDTGGKKTWDNSVVLDILRDERYLGKNIYGKQGRVGVGSPRIQGNMQGDWIKVDGCHEPIVSADEFRAAHKNIHEYVQRGRGKSVPHLFSRKLRCMDCGHSLWYLDKAVPYYRCMTWKNVGDCACMGVRLKETELAETVLATMQLYIRVLLDGKGSAGKDGDSGCIPELRRRLAALQAENKRNQERKAMLYDRFADGEIGRDEFQNAQGVILRQQEEGQQRYEQMQRELLRLERLADTGRTQGKQWKDYQGAKELTREMVEEFVERIDVYTDGSIRIQWKFGEEDYGGGAVLG